MLTVLRIPFLLFAIALAIPLAWSAVDVRLRVARRQVAYANCAAFHRELADCMHLHPGAELHPRSYEQCRAGGHSHADCSNWNPTRSR